MLDDPCSRFLPPVHPPPSTSLSLTCISRLSTFFAPTSLTVELRFSLPTLSSGSAPAEEAGRLAEEAGRLAEEEEEEDAFERGYARGWLERVVAIGLRVIGRGEDEEGEWEEVVEKASGLLAFLSGPSAQGSSSTTYLLPSPPCPSSTSYLPTPPPTRPASTTPSSLPPTSSTAAPLPSSSDSSISLTIRDTTLLSNSTGHRTWGAATLLAQSLASSPSTFFPSPAIAFSASSHPARPLKVLELGSGTGLVGLTCAAVLSRLSLPQGAVVTLTDGGPEPASVLYNLKENVEANSTVLQGVQVEVEELDWREFFPAEQGGRNKIVAEEEKYDVILASDVAYEPGMADAVHAAVAGLLRFPPPPPSPSASLPTASPAPPPAFHLIIPLRRTHTRETADVDRLFPFSPSPSPSPSSPSSSPSPTSPPIDPSLLRTHNNKTYRLVSRFRQDMTGPDGFGGKGGGAGTVRGRGRGRAEGEMTYRVLRAEWEEVEG